MDKEVRHGESVGQNEGRGEIARHCGLLGQAEVKREKRRPVLPVK